MASDLVVVIMAGGAGTRFWPASTRSRPKQFLPLVGERTLLQQAFDRVRGLVPAERTLVVTANDFVPMVRAQLKLPKDNVIGEPQRKDTAAAVALSTLIVQDRFGDATIATITSDHVISPTAAFQRDLVSAFRAASTSTELYTFGVPPGYPATGYGYLELGERVFDHAEHYVVKRFVEKPTESVAQEFFASGRFLWNSGMFVWRASSILSAFAKALPEHVEILRAKSPDWSRLQKISIDKGVMEKAADVRCVKASFSWSDVGSFPALGEHLRRDAHGNQHRARLAARDAHRNVVWSEDESELVAVLGVDDLIVVRSGKRTLVAPKSRAEDIKKLVESLGEEDT